MMTSPPHDRTVALRTAKIQFGGALGHALLEAGKPSYRDMLRQGFSYSPATITRVLRGDTLPKWDFVAEFLRLCGVDPVDIERSWRRRWVALAALTKPPSTTAFNTENGTGHHTGTPTGFECPTCGSWVTNPDRHDEWHNTLANNPASRLAFGRRRQRSA